MNDWQVLDLEENPTPGDPEQIGQLAGQLSRVSELADEDTRQLRAIADGSGELAMQGDYAPRFEELLAGFPVGSAALAAAYHDCGTALSSFVDTLRQAQARSGAALDRGTDADQQYRMALREFYASIPGIEPEGTEIWRGLNQATAMEYAEQAGLEPQAVEDVAFLGRYAGQVESDRQAAIQMAVQAGELLDEAESRCAQAIQAAIPPSGAPGRRGAISPITVSTSVSQTGTGPLQPREAGREPDARTECGDPVDVVTGAVTLRQTDLALPGALPLRLSRTHLSSYRHGRWFGPTWASSFDERLEVTAQGVLYVRDNGVLLVYPHPDADGAVLPDEGARWPLAPDGHGGYRVDDPVTGLTRHFPSVPGGGRPLAAMTDRNGHRIEFERAADGAPVEVRHSGGYRVRVETANGRVTALRLLGNPDVSLLRFEYTDGVLTGVRDSSDTPLRLRYDGVGRLTEWVDRNGTWYRYSYDDKGRCVAQAGPDGVMAHSFGYHGDRTEVTDSLGHNTVYHLNDAFQVVGHTDPLGNQTRFEFDRHDRPLSTTDALGRVTRYDHDEHGNLTGITRPDGTRTRAEYNAQQLPTTVTLPDGGIWRRDHDRAGNLIAVTDPSGAATRYTYDRHGHLVELVDALGGSTRIQSDPAGLPISITDPTGSVTRYRRDGFGRVVDIVDSIGGTTHLVWTTEGKPASRTAPDGTVQRWAYDGEGNLVEYIDQAGRVTSFEYSHFDRLSAQVNPDGTRLEFSYDTDLRLTRITDAQGLTWDYAYDSVGQLVAETDFDHRSLAYDYDAVGRLTRRVNGTGETIDCSYDVVGRVVEERTDETVTEFEYDLSGQLLRATNSNADLVYQRDALGRIRVETTNGRAVTSEYDALGRRTRRTVGAGSMSEWTYDGAGNATSITIDGRVLAFERDAAGRETRRLLGNAAVLENDWDGTHRPTVQRLFGSTSDLVQRRSYDYGPAGDLTAVDDVLRGVRRYDLDPAGRVTAVHGGDWMERYAYDSAGNQTDAGWPGADAALGGREYTGTRISRAGRTRYRHDAQGRMTRRARMHLSGKPDVWEYSWDCHDRLTGVTTPDGDHWRYLHDPLGRRIAKQRLDPDGGVADHVDFTWDGSALAEQTVHDQDGARTTTWTYHGLHPMAQIERTTWHQANQPRTNERFLAVLTDLVGTVTELIDETGAINWHSRTTLWGTTASTDVDQSTPLRFPGQYHDPETGLNYNYFRHYDPETGRYLSTDPLGLLPAPNPNTYVPNPHTWADPLGLAPGECGNNEGNPTRKPYGWSWEVPDAQTGVEARKALIRGVNDAANPILQTYADPLVNRAITQGHPEVGPALNAPPAQITPSLLEPLLIMGFGAKPAFQQFRSWFTDWYRGPSS